MERQGLDQIAEVKNEEVPLRGVLEKGPTINSFIILSDSEVCPIGGTYGACTSLSATRGAPLTLATLAAGWGEVPVRSPTCCLG